MGSRAALLGLAAGIFTLARAVSVDAAAPQPSGWPFTKLELGLKNDAPPASNVRAWAPMGLVYQYLAGGAGQAGSWRNWNSPDGQYATIFVQDAKAAGMTPVFTYYQLLQTRAGAGGEAQTVLANLNDTATMQKYFTDYKVMLQKAAGFSGTKVVVHVEPDLWGYIQQRSSNDNAAVIPAKVAATGLSELAGLSNNAAGFARALVKLADLYAPNIILAYHMSSWGTGVDPVYANPTPDQVSALAIRAANFYKSLGAQFDLSFAEFTDRDDGFKASVMGKPDAFWTALDFDNHIKWLSAYSSAVGHRVVLWQIPFGNRRMKAQNNSPNHFQSSQVETLLDDTAQTRLRQYRDAGVIAFLFGTGADDQTHINDFAGDGITNPAPINGNSLDSYSSDDDGGFFKRKAANYYAAGALTLDGGATGPTTIAFSASADVSPASPSVGTTVTIQASVTSTGAPVASAIVQINAYNAAGQKVFNKDIPSQSFVTNETKIYASTWRPAAVGTYTVKIGTFSSDWSKNYYWNDAARIFSVR